MFGRNKVYLPIIYLYHLKIRTVLPCLRRKGREGVIHVDIWDFHYVLCWFSPETFLLSPFVCPIPGFLNLSPSCRILGGWGCCLPLGPDTEIWGLDRCLVSDPSETEGGLVVLRKVVVVCSDTVVVSSN